MLATVLPQAREFRPVNGSPLLGPRIERVFAQVHLWPGRHKRGEPMGRDVVRVRAEREARKVGRGSVQHVWGGRSGGRVVGRESAVPVGQRCNGIRGI